jgi:glutamate-1-semialdehyde aminotransferase
MGKGQVLYKQAKKIIPGGTQLLSKRPEMFLPDNWPSYYKKAKGCEVWDLDGRKYIDMSYMGIGANVLGYADPDVNKAVKKAVENSNMCTLNAPEEVELARLLIKLHPWAQMARFARCGGEAMAIAIRIARASTGKDKILLCGYHGWHDWYLAANLGDNKSLDGHLLPGLKPKGVPRNLKGTALPFKYNDINAFLTLVEKYQHDVAAVVMEPIRNHYPKKGFLETIKNITRKIGGVLIFDEVTSGFRMNAGGAHLKLGINPDMAVFSKSLGNGFPIAAIIGKEKIMKAAEETFISSTMWTDRLGPSAAIATIKKYTRNKVAQHLGKVGRKVQKGWTDLAKKHRLDIEVSGIEAISHLEFKYKNSLALKTLFIQSMLEKGFLTTNALYASYAHKKQHIDKYLKACDNVFLFLSKAIHDNRVEEYLKGSVCHAGFRRLT